MVSTRQLTRHSHLLINLSFLSELSTCLNCFWAPCNLSTSSKSPSVTLQQPALPSSQTMVNAPVLVTIPIASTAGGGDALATKN